MGCQSRRFAARVQQHVYCLLSLIGDAKCTVLSSDNPVRAMANLSDKPYIPLDEVAKVIEEKFQTTFSAGIPTLEQISTMSKEQAVAVALDGNRRRVPFTFVVAQATSNYPHSSARNTWKLTSYSVT